MDLRYEAIYNAVMGDRDAIEEVLKYYDAYITSLSTFRTIGEDGSIYEHGYPESRLIPSSHYEDCNEEYSKIISNASNKSNILSIDKPLVVSSLIKFDIS